MSAVGAEAADGVLVDPDEVPASLAPEAAAGAVVVAVVDDELAVVDAFGAE